jgi:hypothetical protein
MLARPLERRRGEVERPHRMIRLGQVRGHPAAHVAEADEGDVHVNLQG